MVISTYQTIQISIIFRLSAFTCCWACKNHNVRIPNLGFIDSIVGIHASQWTNSISFKMLLFCFFLVFLHFIINWLIGYRPLIGLPLSGIPTPDEGKQLYQGLIWSLYQCYQFVSCWNVSFHTMLRQLCTL